MMTYLKYEVLRVLRNGAFTGYTVGFPVGFYLLFTVVFDQSPVGGSAFDAYYMVSMALYGAIGTALTGVGAPIAMERSKGWTRQLALTPLRPGRYLLIKIAAASVLSLPAILAILLCGKLIHRVDLDLGTWLALVPALWVGALPFVGLGIAIGYTFRDESAQGVALAAYFLMSVAGGLWMPTVAFPAWLAKVSEVLPTYRAGELSWRLIAGESPFSGGALILAAWTVAFLGLAAWRFRRAS
ncbi:ABC transporter permease [Rhizocola hellebori]|nr:ABC transporter permease [Rhizocola hellebori]